MLSVEMLPAGYGDCLWIEYGDPRAPRRILIDGGLSSTEKILRRRIKAAGAECRFELLIISHVDADHIEGIVKLLADPPVGLSVGDVWFNGWRHLPVPPHDRLGPPQGEELTACLDGAFSWNSAFGGNAAVVPDTGPLPVIRLDGGMQLTLLSPLTRQLSDLRPEWSKECAANGLVPGSRDAARERLMQDRKLGPRRLGEGINVTALAREPYAPNDSKTNGSSIAVLAEHGGKRCILAADAFAEVLFSSLSRLPEMREDGRAKVDAYKMSHHGSKGNNSPQLLAALACCRYLVSTNGARHGHPDPETLARVLAGRTAPVLLCFNYASKQTRRWAGDVKGLECSYETRYPDASGGGLRVDM